jgi:FkbM family methyltransferase
MNLLEAARTYLRSWRTRRRQSFAQSGEDLLLSYLLEEVLNIRHATYLDIGAHDPVLFSNTLLFYRAGSHGVCVEPDPKLLARFKLIRPRDVCLNVGVGTDTRRQADFFLLSERTLSTFCRSEAEALVRTGHHRIERVIQIPLVTVTEIIEDHCERCPDLVSLDTEGMDLAILKSFDFQRHRPAALCVETLTHPDERRVVEIADYLQGQEYFIYADTYINSIFVSSEAWKGRGIGEPLRLRLIR